ncbi:MAG: NAD-dependent epimerase/dehydratase family protein [Pedosphaera sp.]|nr:NAD-dependent epimerase/dehydratase family protein [Pedosphaera sp.]
MIVDHLLNKETSIQLTEGLQKRDFIYIDDVVDAFDRILNSSVQREPGYFSFEVGSGKTISIREIVEMITTMVPGSLTVLKWGALPYRANEVMNSSVDFKPLFALGWRPKISLEDGLARMISEEIRS